MNQSGLHYHYDVPGDDFSQAGAASSAVKQILKQLGLDPQVVRNMSIALYEGEINMVIHAGGGEIGVDIDDEKIIAVPVPKLTRRYDKVENYTDLPEITLKPAAAMPAARTTTAPCCSSCRSGWSGFARRSIPTPG